MIDLMPCPCGGNCSLGFQSGGLGMQVVAFPCGTRGPIRGDSMGTDLEAAQAWNEWIAGIKHLWGTPND